MARMKFLCDSERCIECNGCVTACKNEHELPWGVNRRRVVMVVFGAVSVMVAASTALVGPILFFGLIVANLAYTYAGSFRHAWTVPTAALLGMLCLLGGQLILDRVFGFGASLSIIIELVGGLFFLYLVLRKGAR